MANSVSISAVLLTAGAYVGRATLGGVDVKVIEKVQGAFIALVSALAPRSFRYVHAATKASLAGRPDAIIASMLLAAVRSYVSHGGEATYGEERLTGAYVTGRLDVRRTVGLHARGALHKVAFTRFVLDDNTPLNRIICGALGILASSSGSSEFGVQISAGARALRASFGGSLKAVAAMSRRELWLKLQKLPRSSLAGAARLPMNQRYSRRLYWRELRSQEPTEIVLPF